MAEKDAKKKAKPAEKKGGEKSPAVPPRLRRKYEEEVVPALMKKFGYRSKMACPKVLKVCLNIGVGRTMQEKNSRLLEQCVADLVMIAGQKAVVTSAKQSISNFRLREGMQVGCRVTLRGPRMYEFMDRLFNVAMPRIRDFRGIVPRCLDGRGNCSLGIAEHTIFPEIDADKAESMHGLDVTVCTSAKTDDEGYVLLKLLGLPFQERQEVEANKQPVGA